MYNQKTCSFRSRFVMMFILVSICLGVTAGNLTGRITCQGKGVSGVAVSDGYEVVTTDKSGNYDFNSQKRNGYVFYILPRGYEPELLNGFEPQFWSLLQSADVQISETHNFQLKRVKNDKHIMVIGADTHLANRMEDLRQFREGYIPALKHEVQSAVGVPVYSMILGDLTWDNYWFENNYSLRDFNKTCKDYGYPMTLWPVIGNHDNDPSVPEGLETDFDASKPWRNIMCPNYYSFNLGKVHYVVLDDIYYKNENTKKKYKLGVVGARNYNDFITSEQLEWLRKDLSLVKDKNTPIVVGFHIPSLRLKEKNFATYASLDKNTTIELCNLLKDYKTVHYISGHTHINYNAHLEEYPNIMEHNIAAVCATWWMTGALTGHHVCKDGTPGGYSLWTMNGKKLEWKYKSMENNGNAQMRIYDMNTVKERYATDASIRAMLDKYSDRTDYAKCNDNLIYVNVFAYDNDWKVEVTEGGANLPVTRIAAEDPFHTLCYDLPQFVKEGRYGVGSISHKTYHMFSVQTTSSILPIEVKVTDSFGHIYKRSIKRPHPYNLNMEGLEKVAL